MKEKIMFISKTSVIVICTLLFVVPDAFSQVIINHTSVDLYSQIPASYITAIKKMWLNVTGESHSRGYRNGLTLLAGLEPTYAAVTTETTPPLAYREDALRVSRFHRNASNGWDVSTGEEDWYTNATGIAVIKNHITYCNTNSLEIAAIGFGWCWDMNWHNGPTATKDPVYNVGWAGASVSGPEGDLPWGLDSGDTSITGNSVSMDTYLSATQAYIDYCIANGYSTKVFFTTGPVESGPYGTGEQGYQKYLKHEHIRNYVNADASRILFDYADILCWNNSGVQNTVSWNSHTFQHIHHDNTHNLNGTDTDDDADHIGEVGALRLGKALWVLMARLAGWNPGGDSQPPQPPKNLRVVQ